MVKVLGSIRPTHTTLFTGRHRAENSFLDVFSQTANGIHLTGFVTDVGVIFLILKICNMVRAWALVYFPQALFKMNQCLNMLERELGLRLSNAIALKVSFKLALLVVAVDLASARE